MSLADGRWTIAMPITVSRVAPPARVGVAFDPHAFDAEPAVVELGYRWCERFNVGCLDGERGHVQIARLLPLCRSDFELILAGLRAGYDDLVAGFVAQIRAETVWPSPAVA